MTTEEHARRRTRPRANKPRQRERRTFPRSSLTGGDLPDGGRPPSLGHAGRSHLPLSPTFV